MARYSIVSGVPDADGSVPVSDAAPLPVTVVSGGGGGLTDTELPTPVELDGVIPKGTAAPVVGAALLVNDDTNLVQPRGDATNGLDVDVTRLPALVAGTALIGKVGIDQTTPGTTNAVGGDVAHDTADSSNPVKVGGVARSDEQTAVTAADRVNAAFSVTGRLLTAPLVNGVVGDGAACARTLSPSGNERAMAVGNMLYDGAADNWNRVREVVNGQNTDGTGVQAAGILAQYDDIGTSGINENNFAAARIDSRRRLMFVQTHGRTDATVLTSTDTPDYSAGDVIDGIKELTVDNISDARPLLFQSLVVKDEGGQAPAITVMLFKASPSGGTYTDNTALVWTVGDMTLLVAVVKILTTDWITIAGKSMVSFGGIDVECATQSTSLFALVVADATWNAASTSDLTIEFGFEQR